jgi:hypothetical protein
MYCKGNKRPSPSGPGVGCGADKVDLLEDPTKKKFFFGYKLFDTKNMYRIFIKSNVLLHKNMYRIFIKSNVMYNFAGEKIYAIAVEIKEAGYQAQKK